MTTIFSAPTIGDPRATGIKNGGIKAFESDIVYPVWCWAAQADGPWIGRIARGAAAALVVKPYTPLETQPMHGQSSGRI